MFLAWHFVVYCEKSLHLQLFFLFKYPKFMAMAEENIFIHDVIPQNKEI
jgi:hypothetical protein